MKTQSFVKQLIARFALCLNAVALASCGAASASTRPEAPAQIGAETQEAAPVKTTKKKEEACSKKDLQKELAQLDAMELLKVEGLAPLSRPYGAPVPESDYCARNQMVEKMAAFAKERIASTDSKDEKTVEGEVFKKELQESIDSLNALGIVKVSGADAFYGRCYSFACGEDLENLSDLKALVSFAKKL